MIFYNSLFKSLTNKAGPCYTIFRTYRILFIGSDRFSVQHLNVLNTDRQKKDYIDDMDVMVSSSKNAVYKYAMENGLKVIHWPPPLNWSHHYDLGILVSFGNMLSNEFIESFSRGVLNVHPSILPRWRGASPIMHQVLNGDREAGVSLMMIQPDHFDKGPILMQKTLAIDDNITSVQLEDVLAAVGSHLVREPILHNALSDLDTSSTIDQSEVTSAYARKLSAKHAFCNWEHDGMLHIDRQYRALSHRWPLRTRWRDENIRLLDKVSCPVINASINEQYKDLHRVYGLCLYDSKRSLISVRCKDGWVSFEKISYRKPMTAKDFNNGFICKTDAIIFESVDNNLKLMK